ncbi:MAG: hypothetical protein ACPG4X_20355 [Pikeienuella sp.]
MAAAITFVRAMEGITPVLAAQPVASESVTPGGSSAQTTITAKAGNVCVVTTDTAIWVAFGENPTAAAGTGHLILAGGTRDFGHLTDGWKVAYITA